MDLGGAVIYWIDHCGAAPPVALRDIVITEASAATAAAVAFLVAPTSEIDEACRDIRQKLGAHAYLCLVTDDPGREIVQRIGSSLDDLCSRNELEEPSVRLAILAARANERFRIAASLIALSRRSADIQAALNALPTPVFIKDAEARYIGCNDAFEQFIGLKSELIIGKTVHDFAAPEAAARYAEADRSLFAQGQSQTYEASVRFSDGSQHEVMFSKAVFRAPDGAIAGIVGVMLDIDERRRAEKALQESERRYRDVFENVSDCIALIDATADGRFILSASNPAARRACGLPEPGGEEPFIETTLSPTASAYFIEKLVQCVTARNTLRYEAAFDGPSGTKTLLVNLVPVADAEKPVRRIIAIARDITDEREIERLRSEKERDFRTLVDNSPDSIVRYDRACRRLFSNNTFERRSNIDPTTLLGKTPVEAQILGDAAQEQAYQDWLLAVMEKGAPGERHITYLRGDGQRRIGTVRAIPERDLAGRVVSVLTIGADTHKRVSAERKLRQREQEFRTLVENSPDFIIRYDAQCRQLYINPAAKNFFGAENLAPHGGAIVERIVKGAEYETKLRSVVASGREDEMEFALREKDGSMKWSHVRFVPEFDEKNEVAGVLSIARDISEIVESRRKIQHLAFYDALTGLPNRALLSERIAQAAARPGSEGAFALMLLDLDRFKEVNDTFGHAVGDALLCKAAARLRRCLRKSDTISRLGGDEFAILLPNEAKSRDVSAIAAKILRSLARPFSLSGREIMVFASIGIAASDGAQTDVDTLFKRADSAMYHAKRSGRNNYQFFTPEMMARNVWRMAIETNLRHAISRGELQIYFQPRVDLKTREILGAEALLRWRHDELGFLTPDKFISIAEESGQIVEIGRWVLSQACVQAVEWNKTSHSPIKISVNLSSRQFVMNDLVGSLQETLAASGCDPDWLELEITESLLLEDSQTVRSMLQTIRDMGVAIAVDDFGTGFSALGYLTRFPISALKIDRSFIRDIDRDRKRAELVKAIVSISRALELKLVAEGIETEAQAAFLLLAGCEEAQGFLFGGPMPTAEFEEHWRSAQYSAPTNNRSALSA
jgi:diguanylate cyclase (GGDEF)-like protein/PAS domain S-box-containing protein